MARKIRGLTLIELLLAAAMFAIIAAALGRAFAFVVQYQINAPKTRQAAEARIQFEDEVRSILESAYLSPTTTDNTTYLIGTVGGQNPNGAPTANSASRQGTPTLQSPAAGNSGTGADGIVLTVVGQRIPPAYLEAVGAAESAQNTDTGQQGAQPQTGTPTQTDLQTLNDQFGPQGGVAEVAISTTAVGDPGDRSGLFIREQRPPDSDYTQGGTEHLLNGDVSVMQFEFYDGSQWVPNWDTTQSGQRRLPSAIRVTYAFRGDADSQHVFVVRLPLSDITAANPLSSTGTSTTATGTAGNGGGRTTPAPPTAQSNEVPFLPGSLNLFSGLKIEPESQHAEQEQPMLSKMLQAQNDQQVQSAEEDIFGQPYSAAQPSQTSQGTTDKKDSPVVSHAPSTPEQQASAAASGKANPPAQRRVATVPAADQTPTAFGYIPPVSSGTRKQTSAPGLNGGSK